MEVGLLGWSEWCFKAREGHICVFVCWGDVFSLCNGKDIKLHFLNTRLALVFARCPQPGLPHELQPVEEGAGSDNSLTRTLTL